MFLSDALTDSVINTKACQLKNYFPEILPMVAVENPFASSHDLTSCLEKDLAKCSILKRPLYASWCESGSMNRRSDGPKLEPTRLEQKQVYQLVSKRL